MKKHPSLGLKELLLIVKNSSLYSTLGKIELQSMKKVELKKESKVFEK